MPARLDRGLFLAEPPAQEPAAAREATQARVKSRGWQHVAVVLCPVLAFIFPASTLFADGYPAAALAFFVLTGAGFGWFMLRTLNRQERAVVALQAREAELTRYSTLLRNTLENMGEGLSVFDAEGRLIAWNARFAALLGLPGPVPADAKLYDLLYVLAERGDFGPGDPAEIARRRCERMYCGLPRVDEFTSPAGRTLQIRRHPMPDGGVVSLYSDITERKAIERRMVEATQQAEAASRAKSDFLANMSHELRTPLNAIIGFSEALAQEILGPIADPKQLEYIKDIHGSGLLLLSIINDVLDMSKIEAGKLELVRERVSVQDVVAEAVRMVGERARSRELNLVTSLPARPVEAWADERALKQIMLNLLSNAVKFSKDGGRVDIRGSLDPQGTLLIEVEDDGIGMDEEEIDRALQPFGQAKGVITKTHGGTGLGLPIAKGLAEAHGGMLVILSNPGHGTRVRIILPSAQPGTEDLNGLLAALQQRAVA